MEVSLIVYDEVEHFSPWDALNFNYPFDKRRTKVGKYPLTIIKNGSFSDYTFDSMSIKFHKTSVCLQDKWNSNLNFITRYSMRNEKTPLLERFLPDREN